MERYTEDFLKHAYVRCAKCGKELKYGLNLPRNCEFLHSSSALIRRKTNRIAVTVSSNYREAETMSDTAIMCILSCISCLLGIIVGFFLHEMK